MSKTHRLQVLISPGLHARIAKAAQRAKVSQGEWVRRAIERTISQPVSSPDPIETLASLAAPTADIDQMIAEIEAGRA